MYLPLYLLLLPVPRLDLVLGGDPEPDDHALLCAGKGDRLGGGRALGSEDEVLRAEPAGRVERHQDRGQR